MSGSGNSGRFATLWEGEIARVEYNRRRNPPWKGSSVSAGRHRRRRLRRRGPIILVVIVGLLALGAGGSAYAAFQYDQARDTRILPGVTVGGVAVGNMTRAEAVRALEHVADHSLGRHLTIQAGLRSWELPLSSLGLSADV